MRTFLEDGCPVDLHNSRLDILILLSVTHVELCRTRSAVQAGGGCGQGRAAALRSAGTLPVSAHRPNVGVDQDAFQKPREEQLELCNEWKRSRLKTIPAVLYSFSENAWRGDCRAGSSASELAKTRRARVSGQYHYVRQKEYGKHSMLLPSVPILAPWICL